MPTEVEVNEISANRAEIVAYPFESGYAVTLAHPLRRLILGSSIGYAPISIKIEGAAHEFDNIRGMHEDVAVFIINLKNIRFKIKDESDISTSSHERYKFDIEIIAKHATATSATFSRPADIQSIDCGLLGYGLCHSHFFQVSDHWKRAEKGRCRPLHPHPRHPAVVGCSHPRLPRNLRQDIRQQDRRGRHHVCPRAYLGG